VTDSLIFGSGYENYIQHWLDDADLLLQGTRRTDMPIRITRRDDKYDVKVTPPHGRGTYWSSPGPLTAQEVVDRLEELGCHQTDIGDAMFEADPMWLNRLKEGNLS
jgi:hypothetical protein